MQQRSLEGIQKLFDIGEHLKGCLKCHQIPRIGGLVGDPADEPFQIVDRLKVFPDFVADHGLAVQLFHRLQTAVYLLLVDERLFHEAAQHSGAHGRLSLIQHPQERTPLLLLPQRLHQLQIPSGRAVQQHESVRKIWGDAGHLPHIGLLCLIEILEQSPRGDRPAAEIVQPQPLQRFTVKMLFQRLPAGAVIKVPVLQPVYRNVKTLPQVINISPADQERVVADDFRRHELVDFVQKLPLLIHLSHQTLAGGYVS